MIRCVSLQKRAWIRRFCAKVRLMPTLCQEKRSDVWNGVGRCLPNWHRMTSTVKHGDGRCHRGVGLGASLKRESVCRKTRKTNKAFYGVTKSAVLNSSPCVPPLSNNGAFHCMVRFTFAGFSTGYCTWYFLVPPRPRFQAIRTITKTWRVNSTDHWLAGENRLYCVTELATRDPTDPLDLNQHSQRWIGRNLCLNKRTFLYQPKKYLFRCLLRKYRRYSRW